MNAILYARVSTTEQAEHDLSIPAQVNAMHAVAQQLSKPVLQTFKDVGSARTMKDRPGLLAAIKFAAEHRDVDTLIVHRIDRLARNVVEYHVIKEQLRQRGVQVVSVVEHTDATPAGEFMENIFAAYTEFYSANLGLEIRKGMTERLRKGRWIGQPPLGYILESVRLVPDPARARFIRQAFHRYASEHISVSQLSRELHAAGLTTRTGKAMTPNRLHVILRNSIYMGEMKTALGIFPGKHELLVDKLTFQAVQARLHKGRGKPAPLPNDMFPLARQLTCPQCGRLLVGERHVKPNGKIYRYYRCHSGHVSISASQAEFESGAMNCNNSENTIDQGTV